MPNNDWNSFKRLFLDHLFHEESLATNKAIIVMGMGLVVFVALVWPAGNRFFVVGGWILFMSYLIFAAPIFFTLSKVDPKVEKRHVIFLKKNSWPIYLLHVVIGVVVCGVAFYPLHGESVLPMMLFVFVFGNAYFGIAKWRLTRKSG